MSSENNEAGKAPSGIVATLKSNPKALYVLGGAAVVVVVLLVLGGGGGGSSQPAKVMATLAPGQAVTISNPNGGDTQLNALPGLVSAAQSEEDEKQIVCHVATGTRATVVEEQAAGPLAFVKVQVKEGPCQGNSGWTAKINIK